MLELQGVSRSVGGRVHVHPTSLTLQRGSMNVLLGPTLSGKTSLMRAIVGHHKLTSGSISLEGKTLDRSAPSERARSGIAFVPQGREIFPLLTVRENLETGYAGLKRADRNVPDHVFELFPVLKDMLGRRGGDLSGGQQQQLAIGRALVTRPRLLVLDEPTEGIQPSIIKDIGRAITYLRDTVGLTILLVEQYLDFCRGLADHVAIMDRGQIVYAGAAEGLDDPDVRRHLML